MSGGRYMPADAFRSPRFSGIRTYMRLPHVTDLDGVDVAVLGLPFDTATSFRAGARFGPEAIRSASALLRPYNPEQQVDIFAHLSAVDAGDLADRAGRHRGHLRPDRGGARADRRRRRSSRSSWAATTRSPWPSCGRWRRRHGPLALVHLDAHGDTWHEYFGQRYFHGTTFRRAAEEGVIDPAGSVQAGMRGSLYGPEDITAARELGFTVLSTRELRELGPAGVRRPRPPHRVGGRPGLPHLRRRLLRPGLRARDGHARDRRPEHVRGARVRARAARHRPGRLRRGRGGARLRLARSADGAARRDHRLGGDLAARPRPRRRREARA